jgi:hypothetical protein
MFTLPIVLKAKSIRDKIISHGSEYVILAFGVLNLVLDT